MSGRVLVTGGGTGIGRGVARVLVDAGYAVVITGRREGVLREAAEALGAEAVVADVTGDPDALLDRTGPLDHLVHNAGHYVHQPLAAWTAEAFRSLHEVHVVAPAVLSRAWAARRDADRGDASVVMVASTLAARPAPGTGPYAAAKAGMVAVMRALALELAPLGVRANAVLPGVVPTAMAEIPRGDLTPTDYQGLLARLTPLGRLGRPEEVGLAVRALLENPWTTGAELAVDGGLLLG